jgi:putative AdoMet-dependent methyltransferase
VRSRHVEDFNHDELAAGYDEDVLDEADPIRTGYAYCLQWTVDRAEILPTSTVVDLGCGTGNTSALIPAASHLICVDISPKMMELARPKLAHLPRVEFVQADLLEFFDESREFDRLISTYAVHHLTEDEKGVLLRCVASGLRPGGIAVFGDLMFADRDDAAAMAEKYAGLPEVFESFEEEHYWYLDTTAAMAEAASCAVTDMRRFSDLSWGIRVELGEAALRHRRPRSRPRRAHPLPARRRWS